MSEEKNTPDSTKADENGASEEEVRQESSKMAKQAKESQDKATELLQAAAAAGDPEEREKLMKEALEQQMQSKAMGKTARYLRSGTFQGMAVGAGLGVAPGASLGAIRSRQDGRQGNPEDIRTSAGMESYGEPEEEAGGDGGADQRAKGTRQRGAGELGERD